MGNERDRGFDNETKRPGPGTVQNFAEPNKVEADAMFAIGLCLPTVLVGFRARLEPRTLAFLHDQDRAVFDALDLAEFGAFRHLLTIESKREAGAQLAGQIVGEKLPERKDAGVGVDLSRHRIATHLARNSVHRPARCSQ